MQEQSTGGNRSLKYFVASSIGLLAGLCTGLLIFIGSIKNTRPTLTEEMEKQYSRIANAYYAGCLQEATIHVPTKKLLKEKSRKECQAATEYYMGDR